MTYHAGGRLHAEQLPGLFPYLGSGRSKQMEIRGAIPAGPRSLGMSEKNPTLFFEEDI